MRLPLRDSPPKTDFDPYHLWLGIPPAEQPPHHYRLLGIGLYEDHEEVIALAADRQMLFVRQFQLGPHQEATQRLLNQLAAAKNCLLTPNAKAQYDASLQVAPIPPHAEEFREEPPLCSPGLLIAPVVNAPSANVPPWETSATNRPARVRGLSTGIKGRDPRAVRLVGHILAPLLGLMIGWQILQWLRFRPDEDAAAPVHAKHSNLGEAAIQIPTPLVTDNPFDLSSDFGAPPASRKVDASPKVEPKPVRNILTRPSETSPDEVQYWLGKRNEAISKKDLGAALVATERMAALEQADIIAAKISVLESYRGRHSDITSQHTLAEHSLALVDEAVSASSPLAQQAAVFSLKAARQTHNADLMRRATLGVLKTTPIVDASSTSEPSTGEAK